MAKDRKYINFSSDPEHSGSLRTAQLPVVLDLGRSGGVLGRRCFTEPDSGEPGAPVG